MSSTIPTINLKGSIIGCGDGDQKKYLDFTPDPQLQLTPEKKTYEKRVFGPPKILSDAVLQLTPEKAETIIKDSTKMRNKVRFDLPEYSSSTNTNCSEENQSLPSENGKKSFLVHESNHFKVLTDNLFNNTIDGCNSSDSDAATWTDLPAKELKNNLNDDRPISDRQIKFYKPNSCNQTSMGKTNDCIKRRINELTRPRQSCDAQSNMQSTETRTSKVYTFLKKKSGLKKYTHGTDTNSFYNNSNENFEPVLSKAKYHSSLIHGQNLQLLKDEEFDALESAVKKVENDPAVEAQVTKLASVATNICPDAQMYHNLISLHATDLDAMISNNDWKHIKRSGLPYPGEGPKITDMTVNDIVKETCVVEKKNYKVASFQPQLSDLSSVMSLYNHSVGWEEFNIV